MKTVVIHTPFNPFFKFNGAHLRARQIIDFLKLFTELHVIYTDLDAQLASETRDLPEMAAREGFCLYELRTQKKFSQLSGISGENDIYPADCSEQISQILEKVNPDIILVNYIFLSRTFLLLSEKLPCLKIIDLHDKLSRQNVFERLHISPRFFCCEAEHEIQLASRADVLIAISSEEAHYFNTSVPCSKTILLYYRPVECLRSIVPGRLHPKEKITVGCIMSNHVFNRKSMEEFLSCYVDNASVKIMFAGGLSKSLVTPHKTVHRVGFIPSVADFLNACDLVLLPVQYGTGLKIKTADALYASLPIIGTQSAYSGVNTYGLRDGIFSSVRSLAAWLSSYDPRTQSHQLKKIYSESVQRSKIYCNELASQESDLLSTILSSKNIEVVNQGDEVLRFSSPVKSLLLLPRSRRTLSVAEYLSFVRSDMPIDLDTLSIKPGNLCSSA